MARSEKTKSLLNKYVWVIETIRRKRKISFNELNELWQRDIDISGGLELSKRTFDHWKSAIWDFMHRKFGNVFIQFMNYPITSH